MRSTEPGTQVRSEDAQLPKHVGEGKLPITRPGHLVPTSEKATDGVIEVQFHIVPCRRHGAVAEGARPSPTVRFRSRASSSHGA